MAPNCPNSFSFERSEDHRDGSRLVRTPLCARRFLLNHRADCFDTIGNALSPNVLKNDNEPVSSEKLGYLRRCDVLTTTSTGCNARVGVEKEVAFVLDLSEVAL